MKHDDKMHFISENKSDRSTNYCISSFPLNYFQVASNSVATNQQVHQSTPQIGISSPAFINNFSLSGRPGKRMQSQGQLFRGPNAILKDPATGTFKWRLHKWQAPVSLSGLASLFHSQTMIMTHDDTKDRAPTCPSLRSDVLKCVLKFYLMTFFVDRSGCEKKKILCANPKIGGKYFHLRLIELFAQSVENINRKLTPCQINF